jgi:hypothetical protein
MIKNKVFFVGLVLLGVGWYYSGYAGGFNVPMIGNIPLTTIILIILLGSGSIIIGFSLMKEFSNKFKKNA